jgi:protein TonB
MRPVAEQAAVQATGAEARQEGGVGKLKHSDDEPPHSPLAQLELASANVASLTNTGVSADDLRQYRLSLAIAARRFKRYPALARERGWEGTAEVALSFSALLPAPQIDLATSSGSPLLDEHALAMISRAARITALPEGLKGRDLRVLLPVKFSLDEN